MRKRLINVDEALKLKKILTIKEIPFYMKLYALNDELCFYVMIDKDHERITALTKLQLKIVALSLNEENQIIEIYPDYSLDGQDYYDISSVENYLISKNPDRAISEIKERINAVIKARN